MSSPLDIGKLNLRLRGEPPETVLRWAVEEFWPEVVMSSSFQTQSVPLLHIASRVVPRIPILFLDTGYHFPETLIFRDRLVEAWGLNLRVVRAQEATLRSGGLADGQLYRRDPDRCCYLRKVQPMRTALTGVKGWITGIRRDQTPTRGDIGTVEASSRGWLRIHPLAGWRAEDVERYIREHDLPPHPLEAQGYRSIGCAPCTRIVDPSGPLRAGRWGDAEKTECGLHTELRGAVSSTGGGEDDAEAERRGRNVE